MLVAISAAHGRHELTRLWAEHTSAMAFDHIVIAHTCMTEKEPVLKMGSDMNISPPPPTEGFGIHSLCMPNDPLAGKFNAALHTAIHALGATRIMILPSDDFVSKEWVDMARSSSEDYIIQESCAVYSPAQGRAYVMDQATTGTLKFGAGRVISRRAIEAVGGELWPPNLNRGLDTASHHRLLNAGITPITMNTKAIPITDVKTHENIWPFSTWEWGSRDIRPDAALHMVSRDIRKKLMLVR